MPDPKNKYSRPDAPPGPVFFNKKERDFVKQVTDEVTDRVVAQPVAYYPLSIEHSNYHPLYGEAIEKTFLPPIRVYALVTFEGIQTETSDFGVDKRATINVKFHKRRLGEDQNVFVREGWCFFVVFCVPRIGCFWKCFCVRGFVGLRRRCFFEVYNLESL